MREEGKEGGSRQQRTSQSTDSEHKRWSAQEPHVIALRHITPRDFVEILIMSCRFIVIARHPSSEGLWVYVGGIFTNKGWERL